MRPRKPLVMPAFGVIKGGRLDGWSYHFLHFRMAVEHHAASETTLWWLQVVARCTPPGWPFPCDIRLEPEHFRQFRAVPGSRAKRLQADPLVLSAYRLAGLDPPDWLTERTRTTRAVLKRSAVARRNRHPLPQP